MDFRFSDDQLALQNAIRSFCRDRLKLSGAAAREGEPAEPATWRALAELGVFGLLADTGDAHPVEAAIVFESLGAHLVSGPVIWSTIAAALVPGAEDGAVRITGIEVDARTHGPVAVEHAGESDVVLLLRADRVDRLPADALGEPPAGASLDPLTPVRVVPSPADGEPVGGQEAADRLRALGTLLTAASLVGAAHGALEVAREYALERVQFDRPIGSFQAVKHLLADMYVRLEMARSATYAAAAILNTADAPDRDRALRGAKLLAGEAGIANGRTAVQVLGGMGFTWDMPAHYFLKRSWVLEQAFGTAQAHSRALGGALGRAVLA